MPTSLISSFCTSGQMFAADFLQIPLRNGHPCPWLYTSRYRACYGLAPIRECSCWANRKKCKARSTCTLHFLQPFSFYPKHHFYFNPYKYHNFNKLEYWHKESPCFGTPFSLLVTYTLFSAHRKKSIKYSFNNRRFTPCM